MEFGKVTEEELKDIDFSLPKDPPETTEILQASKGKHKTKFYIGCAKWGRKDWIGKFYPEKTKEKDFLSYYAKLFDSIEFNAAAYKVPTKEQVQKWKSCVGKDFIFCPKFTQFITHIKRLKGVTNEVSQFLAAMSDFGENLGPFFLMPHPQMGLKRIEDIQNFIAELPKEVHMFLELRNDEYYESGYNKELYQFLKKHKQGTVITDSAGFRNYVHMHLTTPECFIRFVGNGLVPTDYSRIDDWVKRLKKWSDEGLKNCYFFMHQHEEVHSPELIKYFIEQMNKHAGTDIKTPQLLYENSNS